ncbi:MAG TPA: NUDIX domain-containing protein [Allosphingosinicella sp.]|jgi:predicted NUDIX family NTP pyrophosphohydrolase
MPLKSAGILLYRRTGGVLEVLLTHPGGPFWRNRDAGAWMIPKGQFEEGEDAAACAAREFEEELGSAPAGEPRPLCRIRQKGGKWVEAFALEGDLDAGAIVSNHYQSEWPPRSGRLQSYPEVDKAAWFTMERAREMMLESQLPILDALEAQLSA